MNAYYEEVKASEKVYLAARSLAIEATEVAHLAAVDIAEILMLNEKPSQNALDTYKLAKRRAEAFQTQAHEAWKHHDAWYRFYVGLDKEKPSAAATAEGQETKTIW